MKNKRIITFCSIVCQIEGWASNVNSVLLPASSIPAQHSSVLSLTYLLSLVLQITFSFFYNLETKDCNASPNTGFRGFYFLISTYNKF